MIKPQLWLKYARARRAVAGYPLYDVPHKGSEREELTKIEVQENFEYFMNVRRDRLQFLRNWLKSKFRLDIDLDGNGVIALENWLLDYGGGLLDEIPNMYTIWDSYRPAWQGALGGYNVAIDVGIFVGEFLISRRPNLFWTHFAHEIDEDGQQVSSELLRPFIGGFALTSYSLDPISQAFGQMMTSLQQSKIGEARYRAPRCGLVYECRSGLYLANVPLLKRGQVFIFEDYSNEPL